MEEFQGILTERRRSVVKKIPKSYIETLQILNQEKRTTRSVNETLKQLKVAGHKGRVLIHAIRLTVLDPTKLKYVLVHIFASLASETCRQVRYPWRVAIHFLSNIREILTSPIQEIAFFIAPVVKTVRLGPDFEAPLLFFRIQLWYTFSFHRLFILFYFSKPIEYKENTVPYPDHENLNWLWEHRAHFCWLRFLPQYLFAGSLLGSLWNSNLLYLREEWLLNCD